jgi:hypothetical protein
MTGIQFITDDRGRKTAVVIDLKKHGALWEDIEDVLVSRSRRREKRIPLEKVKAGLMSGVGTVVLLFLALAGRAFGADVVVLLPENFSGWVCVDFGVAGARPLPREKGAAVIKPLAGEALKTSDKAAGMEPWGWKAWLQIKRERRPLPEDLYARRVRSLTGPVERHCAFYGNEDQADAAAEPPGFGPSRDAQGVSVEERRGLIALFEATDGMHWKHRVGWLGPTGTECRWHGVECESTPGEATARVVGLQLGSNNLGGAIPASASRLMHLNRLSLFGNRLAGSLPDPWIRRWQAGELDVLAEMPLLTGVSEIDFESSSSSILCRRHRIVFHADLSVTLYTDRCGEAGPADRSTFCEVKEGRVWWDVARLAWLIERNGFYSLREDYNRNTTDLGCEKTRVTRNGERHEVVDYGGAGPFELWVIETAIEGVAASVEWDKTTTQPACPRW